MLAPKTVKGPQCSQGEHLENLHVRIMQDIEGVCCLGFRCSYLLAYSVVKGWYWVRCFVFCCVFFIFIFVFATKKGLRLEWSTPLPCTSTFEKRRIEFFANIISWTPWMLCFLTHRKLVERQSQPLDTTRLSTFRILYCH